MRLISERAHQARLNEKGVVIKTAYLDEKGEKIHFTDRTDNADLYEGVVLYKEYSKGDATYREPDYNPGVLFTYVRPTSADGRYVCPNCGHGGPLEEFEYGCDHCGSFCNMEFKERNAGSRLHADLKRRKARLFWFLPLFVIAGAGLGLGIAALASRTWTMFDQLKGLIFGALAGVFPFFIFYSAVSKKIQAADEEKRALGESRLKQFAADLQQKGLKMSEYFNLINTDICNYLYNDPRFSDVVDYDIIRHEDCSLTEEEESFSVRHVLALRLTSYTNRFSAREVKAVLQLVPGGTDTKWKGRYKPRPGINLIPCPNCGQSLDLTKKKCEYCGTEIGYVEPLILQAISLR